MNASKPRTQRKSPCRPLRVERDDVLLFITNRTIEERFWFHPLLTCGLEPPNRRARRALRGLERHAKKRYARLAILANARKKPYAPELTGDDIERMARGLVGSALARAQALTGVEIFAFTAMSNHFHAVVRTPRKNAHAFIRDFKSVVATSINRICGRSGPLWDGRASIQPILDENAAARRVGYTTGNPKRAKLVEDPEQWPGLNLAFGINDTDELSFEYFDTAAWHASDRPSDLSRCYEQATLKLSPLPAHADLDRPTYAAAVRDWISETVDSQTMGASSSSKGPCGAPLPRRTQGRAASPRIPPQAAEPLTATLLFREPGAQTRIPRGSSGPV